MHPRLLAGSVIVAAGLAIGSLADAAPTAVPGSQQVSFSVYLPLQNMAAANALYAAQLNKNSPSYHKWLTPAQVSAQFGPSAATFSAVESALTSAGLQVTGTHMFSVSATGPASAVNKAFQIVLQSVPSSSGGTRYVTQSRVILPTALSKVGAKVPGFAFVPEKAPEGHVVGQAPANRSGPYGGYNYNDLKEAYDYPSYASLDGTGVSVAIVMSGSARNEDVAAMFNHENFTATTGKTPPTFTYMAIDGGGTFGGVGDGATDEAELDIQMVLGGAPGANVTQLSIPDLSDTHIFDAYEQVIMSGAYDIVSNSFGLCELFYTAAYNNGYDATGIQGTYDEFYLVGNIEGTTWFVSSGDEGGPGCPQKTIIPYFVGLTGGPKVSWTKGVDSPAISPFATAVGGGNLQTSFTVKGALPSTYVGEAGFGDPEIPYNAYGVGNIYGGYWGAGGGVSTIEPQPDYQMFATNGVNTGSSTMRTIPDIGMLVGGCPAGISKQPCHSGDSSVAVVIGAPVGSNGVGFRFGFIGTSVAAPEMAGATAVALEAYKQAFGPTVRFGNLNAGLLYPAGGQQTAAGGASAPAADQFFHMNIPGNDGVYTGGGTYNYIYGNGSPDVRNLFGLDFLPPAGDPQTPSNP